MASPVPVPQVVVRGEATLLVEPEVADLGVTVTGRGRDREIALERCRARQAEVAEVLEATGGALEVRETTGLSVHDEPGDGALPQAVASVYTRVTVGRLDAVADLAVALGRLDDVDVSGPTWRLRPDSPHVERARLAAVQNAVHRARQYAAAFGAELIALLEVRDSGVSDGGFQVAEAMTTMARFDVDNLHLDLSPARQEVHGTVEVRFTMSEADREVFRG